MDDFNVNLLADSSDAQFVRKLVDELSLHIAQLGPSHHTKLETHTAQIQIDLNLVDRGSITTFSTSILKQKFQYHRTSRVLIWILRLLSSG